MPPGEGGMSFGGRGSGEARRGNDSFDARRDGARAFPLLAIPPLVGGLALDAHEGVGDRLEALFGDFFPALHA